MSITWENYRLLQESNCLLGVSGGNYSYGVMDSLTRSIGNKYTNRKKDLEKSITTTKIKIWER